MSSTIKKLSTRVLLAAALTVLGSGAAANVAAAFSPSHQVYYTSYNPKPNATCGSPTEGCDLYTMVHGALEGDEVIVEPDGIYKPTQTITNTHNIFVHGDFNQPNRPVIQSIVGGGSPKAVEIDGVGAQIGTEGSIISYLDIELLSTQFPGNALTLGGEGTIGEQIFATSEGNGNFLGTCDIVFGRLRNSVCVATGANGSALRLFGNGLPISVNNVDAIATNVSGNGVTALQAKIGGAFRGTLSNVIARGGASGHDIVVDGASPVDPALEGSSMVLAAANSNFDPAKIATIQGFVTASFEDDGDNQSALPHFTNPAARDYSEKLDSPTYKAGFTDIFDNGPLDFQRLPRQFFGVTDIGAYQLPVAQPPVTTTTTTTTTPPPPTTTTTTPGVTTTTPVPDKTPPAFTSSLIKPSKFAIVKGRKQKKVAYSTKLSFFLSEPASVVATVQQKTTGRKSGKLCKKQTKANKKKGKCTLYVAKGQLFAKGLLGGKNTAAIGGKVAGHKLAIGTYRLQLVGTDAAKNVSPARFLNFKVYKAKVKKKKA